MIVIDCHWFFPHSHPQVGEYRFDLIRIWDLQRLWRNGNKYKLGIWENIYLICNKYKLSVWDSHNLKLDARVPALESLKIEAEVLACYEEKAVIAAFPGHCTLHRLYISGHKYEQLTFSPDQPWPARLRCRQQRSSTPWHRILHQRLWFSVIVMVHWQSKSGH